MGRPSSYSEETAEKICERIAGGEALHRMCDEEGMPGTTTVFRWLEANESFRDNYARAREAQAEKLAGEIVEIADTAEDPAKGRLQVDARKWVASKLLPKKYGDKVDADVKLSGGLSLRWVQGDEPAPDA